MRQTQGFTLLELSIVLVIIGLLLGGVFAGQSLIHNSQLNSVIREYSMYQSAVNTFKDQYGALPGDMKNATDFWGTAGGTGSDTACSTAVSTTGATCNGDGNGQIAYNGTDYHELLRFWQQLVNAQMIEGDYTGSTTGSAANTTTPGINVPVSRFASNVGWNVDVAAAFVGGLEHSWFNTNYGTGHIFLVGGEISGSFLGYGASFSPKDAWSLDKKIDDGKPATGRIISSEVPNCTNAANLNDLGTTYKLTQSSPACVLFFLPNF